MEPTKIPGDTLYADLMSRTGNAWWYRWFNIPPYKIKASTLIEKYVHEYIIGPYGVRKSLWFTCRSCEHCNGIMYEDEKHVDYHVSADCKYNGRDIIKDRDFMRCPLDKWVIKRPA